MGELRPESYFKVLLQPVLKIFSLQSCLDALIEHFDSHYGRLYK